MPRRKHVKIIIASDGTCTVDAIDFIGPACQAATLEIAAALGGQIDHQHDQPEARLRERSGERGQEAAKGPESGLLAMGKSAPCGPTRSATTLPLA